MPWPISTCGITSAMRAGLVDADEGVGRELAVGHIERLHRLVDRGAQRQVEGQHEAGGETAGQQRAA